MSRATFTRDGGQPPVLLMRLLGGGVEPCAEQRDVVAAADEQQLADIRSSSPRVEWFGVNGSRVDAVVSVGDDEYRIVYFSLDGETIDTVSVFRRPPRFDGVGGGRIVVVNGPSGSGKSSLLTALGAHSALPWVLFDEPVMGHLDQGYLIWRDQAPTLHRGFLDAIAALARRGNLVGVSAAGHPAAAIDEAFAGVPVLRVGLECATATLLERERGRAGRWGGIVADSLADHNGWSYDIGFDTARLSPAEMASEVLRRLELS